MEDEHYQLIEKKIDGALTPEEAIIFEHRLSIDPVFAEEYNLQKQMVASLRQHHKQALKEEFTTMYRAVKHKKRRKQTVRELTYWTAAAFLIASLAVGYFMFFAQPNSQVLYTTYYEIYPADPVMRGEYEAVYGKVMTLYQQGDFQTAIPLFEQILEEGANGKVKLLLGNCYLKMGAEKQAITTFKQVTLSGDSIIQQHGYWYLALSNLKYNNRDEALNILKVLSNQSGPYQQKAKALYTALE